MTISGKTNLITEILAAAVWLIAVASAGPDRLIVGVFSFPLLILVPICGWLLMPISKKILKKAKDQLNSVDNTYNKLEMYIVQFQEFTEM